ncbi:high affinity methionine permease [Aspergillus vadensis CBS 113365]|uniref:Amino acid transporter n=1 Tax=Aspergillus vadensis (strain CBS 113365 / IMI 142717 / IBT 24658) TaxID=1448311 RepID=A0A319BMS9_ASPVC|nr:amino acid transporter [Aspergillus vadensis CBS 113365]PYH73661.1 amino acid transporter [Aspergillus vadensis CBS 113365]
MTDPVVESAYQKGILPDAKAVEEGPRRTDGVSGLYEGNVFEATPDDRRQIGVISASFLIFNRVIGTGIFATPSTILSLSGSVGLSLIMWVIGTLIAMAGTAVYLEWGTAIPKNGGEKNYLEYVFKKPKFLMTAMYAAYAVLLGWAASNSVVFGEYILNAADIEVDRWNQRGIGLACITAAFLIHSFAVKWGLMLQNFLGVVKLVIILFVIVAGWVALAGHMKIDPPHNFTNAFEGTTDTGYGIVMALYNVIWSFIGYSNANYALSETKNPTRTLKIAAPIAIISVGIMYMLCNIAYFAAVPKEQMLSSGQTVAAAFFGNMFGARAEKVMSVFVALSAFGNVLSVIFSQGRIVQALGREGVLPLSKIWASNRPFNSPAAGLFEHWVVSVIIMLAPPPGDAYNFLVNLISYPLSIVNVFVSGGLVYIYLTKEKNFPDWAPGIRATLPVTIFFCLSNMYLVVAPYVPPSAGQSVYNSLPYYLHCVVALGIFALGAIYYLVWAVLMPRFGRYILVKESVVDADGWSRSVFTKMPIEQAEALRYQEAEEQQQEQQQHHF